MTSFNRFLKKKTKERLDKFYSHVKPEIKNRVEHGKPLTSKELNGVRCNSYEQKLLHTILDNDALIDRIKLYMLQNGTRALFDTELATDYQDALLREFLPMLLDRFEQLEAENKNLRVAVVVGEKAFKRGYNAARAEFEDLF